MSDKPLSPTALFIVEPPVRQDLRGHLAKVWLGAQVRANTLVRSVEAVDFVAAVAAVGPHELITTNQFRRGRIRKPFAWLELNYLMMTLQAIALDEAFRCHREDPVM